MKVRETLLPGVLLLEPRVFGDARGWFFESFRAERYRECGVGVDFVQDNFSFSQEGVLRGVHYQWPDPQAKLVSVLRGAVLDVAVDLRPGSPTHGRWISERLDEENRRQLFLPAGFGHGFLTLAPDTLFHYKCSTIYRPEFEQAVRWSDPELGIEWGIEEPKVSEKDREAPLLAEIDHARLPKLQS